MDTSNVCSKCRRADCPLLATVIIGERAMHMAVLDCRGAQAALRIAERISPHSRVAAPRGAR